LQVITRSGFHTTHLDRRKQDMPRGGPKFTIFTPRSFDPVYLNPPLPPGLPPDRPPLARFIQVLFLPHTFLPPPKTFFPRRVGNFPPPQETLFPPFPFFSPLRLQSSQCLNPFCFALPQFSFVHCEPPQNFERIKTPFPDLQGSLFSDSP